MNDLLITTKQLEKITQHAKNFNIFPLYFSQYVHRNDNHPFSSLLTEVVDEVSQYLTILNKDEVNALIASFSPGIKVLLEEDDDFTDTHAFNKRGALYYIIHKVQLKYFSFQEVVRNDPKDSIVLKTYPELAQKMDDDGLLKVDKDFKLFDAGIQYKSHILHYHQLFRRGFTSNPNFSFLLAFTEYYKESASKNTFRIAVDHCRIMPKEFFEHTFEFDTWYGPKFDRKEIDNPYHTSRTVIVRSKPSPFDLTNRLERTEFFWSFRDGIKTFEIEEIAGVDNCFDNFYFNRYIHTERDINQQLLRHFDGAVKVYLNSDYPFRLQTQIPDEPRSYKKIKLFRIDGDIDIDSWVKLIAVFYKNNEMVIEYFDPKQYEQRFAAKIKLYQKQDRQRQ